MSSNPELLEIHGFEDRERSKEVSGSPFKCRFNPKDMVKSYSNQFNLQATLNSSGEEAHYNNSNATILSFSFILDQTVTSSEFDELEDSTKSVVDQLKEFITLCYEMNGDIHEPNFLTLNWGEMIFRCRLQEMDLNYEKFNNHGQPARVKVQVCFVEDIPNDERLKRENKSSPDLHHVLKINDYQNLPNLCHDIYKDSCLYLKLAHFNNLDNFRDLHNGHKLVFPPLKELIDQSCEVEPFLLHSWYQPPEAVV